MLKDIVAVRALSIYVLHLRFEDGVEADVNLSSLMEFRGVFAPLQNPSEFAKVRVDPELGTIVWPNGADLDPDVLYSLATGQPIVFEHQHA
jgi:Protein of unknown function (DUF2442)